MQDEQWPGNDMKGGCCGLFQGHHQVTARSPAETETEFTPTPNTNIELHSYTNFLMKHKRVYKNQLFFPLVIIMVSIYHRYNTNLALA
jgi:hypothetical protein